MAFSKSFPRTIEGSNYPKWEEVFLSDEEELDIERRARAENMEIMKECIDDAKAVIEEKGFKGFKEDILKAAIPLFEKRASHTVYWKERRCKEKAEGLNR
ncbi:hypothetical protein KY358_07070 [Candidatus Woesearchaeota archaeon]|nr:hypothetical protein [Candidatus Woesearchaeota archaeon]